MRSLATPLVVALAVGLAACGGDDSSSPTAPDQDEGPTTGAISVSTSTTGPTPDPDGYAVAPDGESAVDIGTDSTVVFTGLSEDSYSISLSKVATNCQQNGSASATVTAGDTVSTTVNVECAESVQDRIIFSSDRDGGAFDIYSMAHDGTDVERITVGADIVAMDVNDAGTAILAVAPASSSTSNYELQMVEPDGSVRQFTSDTLVQMFSTLNSDGSEVIYAGEDTTTNSYSLFRRSTDGSGGPTPLVADSINSRQPDWSPDGSSVAFIRQDTASGSYGLYTADDDGSNVSLVAQDTTKTQQLPDYSPSGDRLAYQNGDNIAVLTLQDGSEDELSSTNSAGSPDWLPGGQQIVYHYDDGNDMEIYRIDVDGTDEIPLTGDGAGDWYPLVARWSSGNASN